MASLTRERDLLIDCRSPNSSKHLSARLCPTGALRSSEASRSCWFSRRRSRARAELTSSVRIQGASEKGAGLHMRPRAEAQDACKVYSRSICTPATSQDGQGSSLKGGIVRASALEAGSCAARVSSRLRGEAEAPILLHTVAPQRSSAADEMAKLLSRWPKMLPPCKRVLQTPVPGLHSSSVQFAADRSVEKTSTTQHDQDFRQLRVVRCRAGARFTVHPGLQQLGNPLGVALLQGCSAWALCWLLLGCTLCSLYQVLMCSGPSENSKRAPSAL